MEAFHTLEGWVRSWAVPTEEASIDPPGITGACVTLRLSGRTLGRGTSIGRDGSAIWRAAREAWVQAVEAVPVERDALRAERVLELTPRILIDLQLAGELTPTLGEDEAMIAAEFSPGIHGVAARLGERFEAVFPGVMLSTNITPAEAIRVAAGKLDLPPQPIGELRRSAGLIVYRFPVRHLAQPAPLEPPRFLYRGGRIIGEAEVTAPALRATASEIASHLLRHAWPGEEPHGMTGDYQPLLDRYNPIIATPMQQAACAYALARFASTPGIDAALSERALRFARRLVAQLAEVSADESDPLEDPLSAAMFVLADGAAGRPEEAPERFRAAAIEKVAACIDHSGGWTPAAPSAGRGLIALALIEASGARQSDDDGLRAAAGAAVRSLFRTIERPRLAAEMPWLGWAELALTEPGADPPALLALVEMRQTIWNHQIVERDTDGGSADLIGGVVFTRSRNPLPNWHTLRPLAFLATMLGDRRFTPDDEAPGELGRLRRSLRFLMQLTIDDPLTHMYRDPDRARGGVRPAVWDQTASLEASAMGLLFVCETLRALDARAR